MATLFKVAVLSISTSYLMSGQRQTNKKNGNLFTHMKNNISQTNSVNILNPANISTLVQRCFKLIWRHDVAQRLINVEIMLCTSTLKFTTWSNVETTLRFSTWNWTTLGNVETTLSFSTSIFTTFGNVVTALRTRPFEKIN